MNDSTLEAIVPSVIYGLYDPRDPLERIRYIGRTQQKPRLRLSAHKTDARGVTRRRQKRPVCNWIAKLLKEGVEPCMRILQECDSATDREIEIQWISNFRIAGITLLNGTDGGDGGGINPTPERRSQMSESTKKRWEDPEGRESMMKNRIIQTHCVHGHEFSEENTYVDARGSRHCRICQKNRQRAAAALQPRKKRQPKPPRFRMCPICGESFQVGGAGNRPLTAIYCSQTCVATSQRHPRNKCEECGVECPSVNLKFCSRECSNIARVRKGWAPMPPIKKKEDQNHATTD